MPGPHLLWSFRPDLILHTPVRPVYHAPAVVTYRFTAASPQEHR